MTMKWVVLHGFLKLASVKYDDRQNKKKKQSLQHVWTVYWQSIKCLWLRAAAGVKYVYKHTLKKCVHYFWPH